MQDASTNDVIELVVQVRGVLDWQLPRFEIREVVLLLQLLCVLETGRADVNGNDAGRGMTDRIFCRLPRATAGNENIHLSPIFPVGPEQVELRPKDVLVLVHVASAIQIIDWRRIRMLRVKLINRIGTHSLPSLPRFWATDYIPYVIRAHSAQ